MNARVGFGTLAPGAISIMAEIADNRICSVRVVSSRSTHLTRLFIGRSAHEIPALSERLFSLCGFSHMLAATGAIAAARGETPFIEGGSTQTIGRLCERLSETLRSSVMNRDDAFALDGAAIRPLREILSLTRELSVLAMTNRRPNVPERSAMRPLVDKLYVAARELGLWTPSEAVVWPPKGGSWFGELWKDIEGDQSFAASVPDTLEADDDAAILDGLRQSGERFAAAPSLAGRAPETGAYARHWREVDFSGGALPARLHARMIDLAQCLERLSRARGGDVDESNGRSTAAALREGFAAVETSRGDLYHWARLTSDDKIENYAIVAPTEWNFHPAGPFVAALLGARVPRSAAHRSIARLAGLFDPCVVFRVDVREAAHA